MFGLDHFLERLLPHPVRGFARIRCLASVAATSSRHEAQPYRDTQFGAPASGLSLTQLLLRRIPTQGMLNT